jgi:DNA-binding transcriptional regulator YiaG
MTPEKLKKIRTEAGMSINEMAKYLWLDPRTVRRYEDGTRNPSGAVLKLYTILLDQKYKFHD